MGNLYSLYICPPAQDRSSSVDTLSDEEILSAINGHRKEDAIGFRGNRLESLVHPISSDAVFKHSTDAEIFTMGYIASHTSIPIPQVRRVLPMEPRMALGDFSKWLVMDRIDGEPLATAWPKLSWWYRLRVIWTMRKYVQQIHSVPVPYPGKPGKFDASGRSYRNSGSYFTTSGSPPFESSEDMANWFNHRRWDAMVTCYRRRGYIPHIPKFDRTQPLIVCHMDLHLDNIMIDRSGVLWIIDWGAAGAFPAWLEYASASQWVGPWVSPEVRAPWLWGWCLSLMFGNYRKFERDFLDPIGEFHVWSENAYEYEPDYLEDIGVYMD